MRISDWSSDVCSSDLWPEFRTGQTVRHRYCVGRRAFLPQVIVHICGKVVLAREQADLQAEAAVLTQGGTHHDIVIQYLYQKTRRTYAAYCAIGRASCRERACQYV